MYLFFWDNVLDNVFDIVELLSCLEKDVIVLIILNVMKYLFIKMILVSLVLLLVGCSMFFGYNLIFYVKVLFNVD